MRLPVQREAIRVRAGWIPAVGASCSSGSVLERDFGGVAERVKNTQQQVRRDALRVAVHDGRDARARRACQAGNLTVGQALAADGLDNFRVQYAAKFNLSAIRGSQP